MRKLKTGQPRKSSCNIASGANRFKTHTRYVIDITRKQYPNIQGSDQFRMCYMMQYLLSTVRDEKCKIIQVAKKESHL